MKKVWMFGLAMVLALGLAGQASAAVLFESGILSAPDGFALVNFTVVTPAEVTIKTTSHSLGGFDTVLTLFDGAGFYIDHNDDIDGFNEIFDSQLVFNLISGSYIVAVTQSDNYLNFGEGGGPYNLSLGFANHFINGFFDFFGQERTANWNVEISGDYAPAPVPIPAAAWLLGSGLIGLVGLRKRLS